MDILVNKEKLQHVLRRWLDKYNETGAPCDCGLCPLYESNQEKINEEGCDKDCTEYIIKYLQS